MLEHVLNLGNQLKTDLEISEGFTSIDYDRMLIVGMGGSGVAGDVLKLILLVDLSVYSFRILEIQKRQLVLLKMQ